MRLIKKTLKWIVVAFFASTILSVVALRFIPVVATPLMLIRCYQQVKAGEELKLSHDWESLENISPHLPIAVMASEDANGLDAVKVTFDSGILFSSGKSTLSPTSKASLQELANVLKNNRDCDVAIQGYTDNQGWKNSTAEQSAQKNKALSLDRAAAVSSYLQSLSVPTSQIKSVDGFGEQNPVASNATAAGQAQNRRVEVYMYASQKMINEANAQAGK